jgi:hypothetical protein
MMLLSELVLGVRCWCRLRRRRWRGRTIVFEAGPRAPFPLVLLHQRFRGVGIVGAGADALRQERRGRRMGRRRVPRVVHLLNISQTMIDASGGAYRGKKKIIIGVEWMSLPAQSTAKKKKKRMNAKVEE